jgi:Lon protease-like protein
VMSGAHETGNFPTPSSAPVMTLRQSHLFPHTLMPLHIFEPRYREMLRYALETDRMWVIACPRPENLEEVYPVAGLGLIRACVQNPDGTSNLVMQGLRRVRMGHWHMEGPFRVARLEVIQSVRGNPENLEVLSARLLKCVSNHKASGGRLPDHFEKQLAAISSPEIIADIVSAALVADPQLRQALIEEVDVAKRIERLLGWFE